MIADNPSYTYRPTIKRILFVFAGLPIGAQFLGFGSRFLVDFFSKGVRNFRWQADILLMGVAFFAIWGALLAWNIDHFYITITPATISGPTTDGILGETTFSLDRLDIDSINRITLWDKVWMRRRILSKDREKIVISRLYYAKAQENEIITTLLSLAQHHSVGISVFEGQEL